MPLLQLQQVSISFGASPLLERVNFSLDEKERVCLLGRNGMGKSTLLKLVFGDLHPDQGNIIKQTGLRIARLEQDVPDDLSGTVYDVIASGLGEIGHLFIQYEAVSIALAEHATPELLKTCEKLQHALDTHQAWNMAPQIQSVIDLLNLPPHLLFSELSGGLKRRVLLGRALVIQPHVLLLDEPTNHLDIEAIEWLESFVKNFSGALIFITHDRRFMQEIATKIIELDRGQLRTYPDSYAAYLTRKQQELLVEETHAREFDKKLAAEEVWIRQGIKARRTRNEGRVRALEKLRQERAARRVKMGSAQMQVQEGSLSGKLVIEAHKITYQYNGKTIIPAFSTRILRGDKIGIIGPNGAGKSTLLKILLAELPPQSGYIKQGTQLEIAYFDQLRAQLDEENTVEQNVSYGDQYVHINGKATHIMSYLQDFLFSPERARTPVKSLSGGERNRLLLARLFSKPANLLIMDEPTNDLDIETLELLESLLTDYQGTLILVSHDRSFLNNVVTSTLVFEKNGELNEYVGGYDDWIAQTQNRMHPTAGADELPNRLILTTDIPAKVETSPSKNTYHTQKEIRTLEQKIDRLEKKLAEIDVRLSEPALYTTGEKRKLTQYQSEHAALKQELQTLYARWEILLSE